jgi:hypothetical protein
MPRRRSRKDAEWYRTMLGGLHTGPHCETPLLPDPRGPRWLLAGLCVACGRATARRLPDGTAHCRGALGEFAVRH